MATPKPGLGSVFLAGGGEMGERMRSLDWSRSPLGPPDRWPQSLRTVVRLMLDSKFPMFVAWGRELGFLYNDSYAEILGQKHPAALGARFHDIWGEIWDDISPLIDAAMRGEATYHANLPLIMHRKGFAEQTWFTFSYSPVHDDAGEVAGMFCACTETTKQIAAETELRQLNETLEARVAEMLAERRLMAEVIEGTEVFVQVVAPDFSFLAINDASASEFERIFGVRPKVGDNMLTLLDHLPDHRHQVEAVWQRALNGEEFTEVGEFGDPALDRRYYEMKYFTLRDSEGRPAGAYQFVYDVTDRVRDETLLREAQDALRQSQKLETMGQLTGGVAHDLNNLLTPIVGALDILQRKVDDDPRAKRLTAGAILAAERATTLVQRLLSFSRRQLLETRAVDVVQLVANLSDLVGRSVGPQIEVVTDFEDDLPPARVDRNQLELALLNLAVNARDALNGKGVVRIRGRRLDVTDHPRLVPGAYLSLAVIDTGAGMDPETLRRATEPFFTTKSPGQGTGLGLAAVHGLAEQLGGLFELQSEVGKGTTATLVLPVDGGSPSAPDRVERRRSVRSARGDAILLVDDDELVRDATAHMLSDGGYAVRSAASAREALDMIRSGFTPALLVSDFAMPGMSGVEFVDEARRIIPELPAVLISGFAAEADEALRDSGLPMLDKPFQPDVLLSVVAASLRTAGVDPDTR